MKKWDILKKISSDTPFHIEDVVNMLLDSRGLESKKERDVFLHPFDPYTLNNIDVGIEKRSLATALNRISRAIKNKESIVVYADYDADGICAGAIIWETLHHLKGNVMPYIPRRSDEGYGLSKLGIDNVVAQYHPGLIVTVDHGITAKDNVAYAKSLGIDVIVTDHHVKPEYLPDCIIVHTTQLCGAGVSWFVAKELLSGSGLNVPQSLTPFNERSSVDKELLALAAIGTIADLVPLVGPNRAIVKYGLEAINTTKRVGLDALIADAGLSKGKLSTFEISHILAPRLNAMGRLEHAMDALRLICTLQKDRALELAQKLSLTNKERQQMTVEMTAHALEIIKGTSLSKQGSSLGKKLIFLAHESYNQGVIGLIAGKLVEEYYLPALVIAKGEFISKASARSISGFNIVEAIRSCSDILIDVGGHPMAAGFTVETKNLVILQERMEILAEKELDEEKLTRKLKIDAEIPLEIVGVELWTALQQFQPFGFGNYEPVFVSKNVKVTDARLIGADGKHLKLKINQLTDPTNPSTSLRTSPTNLTNSLDAIAFNQGSLYNKLQPNAIIDIAYTIDMNEWNGKSNLQLKIKDIQQ